MKHLLNSTLRSMMALVMMASITHTAQAGYEYRVTAANTGLRAEYKGMSMTDVVPLADTRYDAMSAVRTSAYRTLRSEWNKWLLQRFQSDPRFDGHTSWARGDIQIGLSGGNYANTSNVTVSGLDLGFHADFSEWRFGVKVRCYMDVTLPGVTLSSGELDLQTGTIKNAVMRTGTPRVERGCSSSISWIPILGDIADDAALDAFNSKLGSLLQSTFGGSVGVNLRTLSFAGLNAAVPAGRFVFGGIDVGQWVVNNLPYLIQQGVVIRMKEDPPIPSPALEAQTELIWDTLSVSFGDGTKFSNFRSLILRQYWNPSCGSRSCAEP